MVLEGPRDAQRKWQSVEQSCSHPRMRLEARSTGCGAPLQRSGQNNEPFIWTRQPVEVVDRVEVEPVDTARRGRE